jgi:pyridoxal phosphate enzyme (YggS family)
MTSPAAQNYHAIQGRIRAACVASGRDPGSVRLIAVTKTYGAEDIKPLLDLGHRDFGENRVQEALGKWPALVSAYPGTRLHLIGPLQTNKVAEAVAHFNVIHTLDRMKLARALAGEMKKQGRAPQLLVQVNTGREPQKAGLMAEDLPAFLLALQQELAITPQGLMCIPPVEQDANTHFALLARLAQEQHLSQLSMGMSSDFTTAIATGATMIRVGSAIFGARAMASPPVAAQ